MQEILRNIFQFQVPLPESPLKELNCYLVRGDGKSLLIDTGFNHPVCEKAVLDHLCELGVSLDDTDIFLTHLHTDHAGLAMRLKTPKNRIFISQKDGDIVNRCLEAGYWENLGKYQSYMGFPEDARLDYRDHPGYKHMNGCSLDFTAIRPGDFLDVGEYHFKALDLSGHTPGQLGLYDAGRFVLFGGDHILAKISPNINLWDFEEDYLGLFIENLKRVRALNVRYLMSAHRSHIDEPNERIDALLHHHERRLKECREILGGDKKCVYDVAAKMRWDYGGGAFLQFPDTQKWFAASEVFAHLEHLYRLDVVGRDMCGEKYLYFNDC